MARLLGRLFGVIALIGITLSSSTASASETQGSGTAPTLRLFSAAASIFAEWDSVPNASSYRYRSYVQGAAPSAWTQTSERAAMIESLVSGVEYVVDVGSKVNSRWKTEWTSSSIVVSADASGESPDVGVEVPADVAVEGKGTAPDVRAWSADTSVRLEWDAVAGASKYRYRIRLGSGKWSAWVVELGQVALIENLRSATTYTIDVGSRTSNRWKSEWSRVTITTDQPGAPSARIIVSPVEGYEGDVHTFDAGRSSNPNGDLVTYSWDFGDGSTGVGLLAEHIYAHPGQYTVTLEVRDQRGNSDTVASTVTVAPTTPQGLTHHTADTTVHLAWDSIPGASAYRYRFAILGGPWSDSVDVGDATHSMVPGLEPGTTYRFGVSARLRGEWVDDWSETDVSINATGGWLSVDDDIASYTEKRVPTRHAFFDPFANPAPGWGLTRVGFLVHCDSVKFAQVDPIVMPGVHMSHHLHEFFGNPSVDASTTTQSLIDTPADDIACTDRNDKSAYWSPAVFQDGVRVTATDFKAYYKSTTVGVAPIPLGLRMVAGNASATENQSERVGWWLSEFERYAYHNTIGSSVMIPRVAKGVQIVLRINFPNCWDGIHLDSPDHQAHMAYFDEDEQRCPDTHPIKIAQVTTFTQYDTDGGADLSLASGAWYTFHQDFWNGWAPGQMEELTDRCINQLLQCRVRTTPALARLGQYVSLVPAAS